MPPAIGEFFTTLGELIKQLGWAGGTLVPFFWLAHFVLYRMYKGRLRDRQAEIDRLAADNHDYRDRFIALLDKQFQYSPPPDTRPQQIEAGKPPSNKGKG